MLVVSLSGVCHQRTLSLPTPSLSALVFCGHEYFSLFTNVQARISRRSGFLSHVHVMVSLPIQNAGMYVLRDLIDQQAPRWSIFHVD